MKHRILLEVEVNEDWNEYVNGSMHEELIAEDLFPIEARKEGVLGVRVLGVKPQVGSRQSEELAVKLYGKDLPMETPKEISEAINEIGNRFPSLKKYGEIKRGEPIDMGSESEIW